MTIKGETIEFLFKTITGRDPFGAPIVEESWEKIENVLIAPVSDEDYKRSLELYGKKAVYVLALPKNFKNADTASLINTKVRFWDAEYMTIGTGTKGIESLVPGEWNFKIEVEGYE